MLELRIRDIEDGELLSSEDASWHVINCDGTVSEFGDASGRVKDWLEVVAFLNGVELGVLNKQKSS